MRWRAVFDDGGFGGQLGIVSEVLPLAAGALAEIVAGRFNSLVGRVDDADHLGGDVLAAQGDDLGLDGFAGDAAEDEHVAPAPGGHGLAEATPGKEVELDDVASFQRRRLGSGGVGHGGYTITYGWAGVLVDRGRGGV